MKHLLSLIILFLSYYTQIQSAELFLEAESFEKKGGWSIDQQFMDLMGSSYLIAHGLGTPVDDATTTANFPQTGTYYIYVRTYNWTSPWYTGDGPGKFTLTIDGQSVKTELGTTGNSWMWQEAGKINIKNTQVKIGLRDLSGFDGRCDAIYFTTNKDILLPVSDKALQEFRNNALKIPSKPQSAGSFDFVVIGGGNTAMDTARAAKRTTGVEHVYLVYRRTKRYMPADEEELVMAVEDGVEFMELLSPVKLENGKLICEVMVLGDMDASGRRGVVKTGELKEIPADTVIAAVGEKVPTALYEANGINVNDRGRALVNEETLETNVENVYVVGDGLGGPATVVEGIRDGLKAAQAVIGETLVRDFDAETDEAVVYERKGNLEDVREDSTEAKRCLNCAGICENCKEVCPNRANVAIKVPGLEKHQIIHVDYMCNECGNCKSFCPYDSAPYLDKFTLFMDENDMADSKNQGFTVLDKDAVHCKVRFCGEILDWTLGGETKIPEALQKVMETVCKDYTYLLR